MTQETQKTNNDLLLQEGEKNKYITFNEDKTRITYHLKEEKNYKYTDPEEQVRAIAVLRLIIDYQYDPKDISLEVTVPRRTPKDLADIIVYHKGNDKSPYLCVECKKDGISDSEFNQAIEQVFGNANSMNTKYAWVIAGNTETAFDVSGFDSMEREKNVIADIPVNYSKPVEWRYFEGSDKNNSQLKIVSREALIKALEKCHATVWQGGKLNPSDAFDEVSKILFCKVYDEKKTTKSEPYKFQVKTHESKHLVAKRIHDLYDLGKTEDPEVFSEDIRLEDEIVYNVVGHLQGLNINEIDLDSKGVAFERFMGDFFKGKMGQYFTPRNIVDFTVKMLQVKHNENVLDPACGSGGFLLHAMDHIRKEAKDNYTSELKQYKHWHDFASQHLFGIEINEQIARVCKMNMIIHDDGHTNVISGDSLTSIETHSVKNASFKYNHFDVILTNPPFGAKVKKSEKAYLKTFDLGMNNNNKEREAQSTEVLFIERCLEFLKDKGRMGIVLPDGILTNSTLQYVRDYMMGKARIDAVVSIPQTSFSHYGAGVKCSILCLTKMANVPKDYDIFMAIAEEVGYDATGRETEKNDLDEIVDAYKIFCKETKRTSTNSAGAVLWQ